MTDLVIGKLRERIIDEMEAAKDNLVYVDLNDEDSMNRINYFQTRHIILSHVLGWIRQFEKYGDE